MARFSQAGSGAGKEAVMVCKRALILGATASLALAVISSSSALSQTPDRPKVIIGNINFNPTPDGFYNVNVGLYLQRTNNPQVNFNVSVQHVRSLDEVYDKLRPTVDDLSEELKHAEIEKPH